jgi:Na+-transporting NADH:ubiquinone oxidoreductase subunit F
MTILITIITLSIIGGILALILSIAENYIANYGECTININNNKELTIEGGNSLLTTLITEEIFIPSACGGRGSCGYCKIKVDEGGGPLLPTEIPYLSNKEQNENIRLSCQIKVKNDMKIFIPEELFSIKQYKAIVSKISYLTSDIKELYIDFIEPKEIEFKPGQYIQLLAPKYGTNKEEVYRAYSIASTPSNKDHIELMIGLVPNGICSTYVHKHLKENDEITLNGPYGDFYYHQGEDDMICMAIGSGMAPIKSIIDYVFENAINRKIVFFFGARTKDDLFYLEYFREKERQYSNFKFLPTLSRPKDDDEWNGDIGRVTEILYSNLDGSKNKEAYICGNPMMVKDSIEKLKEFGIPEKKIYYDEF